MRRPVKTPKAAKRAARKTESNPARKPARTQKNMAGSGNRSVVVAVDVLKALAHLNGPAALGNIANTAGMSASRTHRYLSGLAQTGLVEQHPGTGHYALGPTAVELGLIALGQTDAVTLGNEMLPELTQQTGLVSLLSTWGSYGPTIIKWERGNLNNAVHIREGRTLPLLTTATGRIFLAYDPRDKWEFALRREMEAQKKSATGRPRPTFKLVEAMRREVLQTGFGRMQGEENPGLSALAAPVFDHRNELVMSLTVISILGTFDDSPSGFPAQHLRAAANQLSRRLGSQRPEVRADAAPSNQPLKKSAAE